MQKRAVNGSYFCGKKTESITSITSIKAVAKYIARYAAHPAISERRILKYDSKTKMVTWFYDPHEDDNKDEDADDYKGRQYVTESTLKFIKDLLFISTTVIFQWSDIMVFIQIILKTIIKT